MSEKIITFVGSNLQVLFDVEHVRECLRTYRTVRKLNAVKNLN